MIITIATTHAPKIEKRSAAGRNAKAVLAKLYVNL
jgi:hypothetical protein